MADLEEKQKLKVVVITSLQIALPENEDAARYLNLYYTGKSEARELSVCVLVKSLTYFHEFLSNLVWLLDVYLGQN